MKKIFFVEMTDTFGGEANYSWVCRFKVSAASVPSAMRMVSREANYSWRKVAEFGDLQRYDAQGACVCAFVELWDEERHAWLYSTVSLPYSQEEPDNVNKR